MLVIFFLEKQRDIKRTSEERKEMKRRRGTRTKERQNEDKAIHLAKPNRSSVEKH